MARSKIVAVTGATSGVGRAAVRAFAARGYDVALLARDQAGLEGAAKEVEQAGGRSLGVPTDVAVADQVENAAARIEAELGPIDVWVNDAMTSVFSPLKEMTAEEYRRVTEVTYLGQVYGTMAALRRMLPRDREPEHRGCEPTHERIHDPAPAPEPARLPPGASWRGRLHSPANVSGEWTPRKHAHAYRRNFVAAHQRVDQPLAR